MPAIILISIVFVLLLLSALSVCIHVEAKALRQSEQAATRASAERKMAAYYADQQHRTLMMDRAALMPKRCSDR